jgi:CHAT domain-containing protein
MIIEYLMSDSILFTYIITDNSFNIKRCVLQDGFYNSFDRLMTEIRSGGSDTQWNASYTRFWQSSLILYKTLLLPVEKEINKKTDLVIIPSGILSYLPFEVLISEAPVNNTPDYKGLHYLIKDHSVSYAYSATTLFETSKRKLLSVKNLLAVAPLYDTTSLVMENSTIITRQQYRQNLSPIHGIKEEVEFILTILYGDALLDTDALESRFKLCAPDYDILHLAMHSYINDDNPMYSKLIFSNEFDNENDGFLNTYEIYNMTLNARMTVLSSCNTGNGKLRAGEGIISLARGFQYAGCPSVVMTLWEVEDKSGVQLMTAYYKYIREGYTKDNALRMAKLKFLANADQLKSHPYFWANYITIGDTRALYSFYQQVWFIVLVSGFLCLLLASLIWYKFHKKRFG